jgi:hypothetical protein
MSDEGNKKKRAKKGESDGAYLEGKKHGTTSKFQSKWLKAPPNDPLRVHWLKDGHG